MRFKGKNSVLLYLLWIVISLPVLSQDHERTVWNEENGRHTYKFQNGKLEVEYRGKITLSENEKNVLSISPGGFLKISKTSFGVTRTVEITGESGGQMEKIYYEGRRKEDWEPEGRQWLSEVLPEVIQKTGLGAAERVRKIFNRSGVDGVIAEIRQIESDFVKSIYYRELIGLKTLNNRDLNTIIESASTRVSSDFELQRVLRSIAEEQTLDSENLLLIIRGSRSIGSDFEKARLLGFILEKDLDSDLVAEIAEVTKEISSDFEKSRLLIRITKNYTLDEDALDITLENLKNLTSDFEKARVMSAILDQNLTQQHLSTLIQNTSEINSDFEQSRVLITVMEHRNIHRENVNDILLALDKVNSDFEKARIISALIEEIEIKKDNYQLLEDAFSSISSDFERARVLRKLLDKGRDLSNEKMDLIIMNAETMKSDFEISRILVDATRRFQFTDDQFTKLVELVSEMNSEFEKSRVIKSVIHELDLNAARSIELLKLIGKMNSNFEKSAVLVVLSNKIPDDEEVMEAYRKAASTITSDFEYGKVMRAIDQ